MRRIVGFTLAIALVFTTPTFAATIFFEDFSDNSAGWTLGPTWAIGSAATSTGHQVGNPDPALDHTPTADNGVAGVVIGGNYPISPPHNFFFLTSPTIDLASATGPVTLELWRWLNSDHMPHMENRIDVFNGTSWVTIFATGGAPAVQDSAWTQQTFDVTAFANANFAIRVGYDVNLVTVFLPFIASGWNIDDVSITDASVAAAVPEPATLLLFGAGLAAAGVRRYRQRQK